MIYGLIQDYIKLLIKGVDLNTQVCLALYNEEVVDFFKKYFIITTNYELEKLEKLLIENAEVSLKARVSMVSA